MTSTVYCTVSAKNYLPQVLSLRESLLATNPGAEFKAFLVDGDSSDATDVLQVLDRNFLPLTQTEYTHLAAIYDVVELSTALKPLLFRRLLVDYEKVIYLDPDMWVTAPLEPVAALLDQNPIQLTPHFLQPIEPGTTFITEVHSLTVGIFNLGFGAFGRGAEEFLDWWWSHLERECLIYPLLGLFVDQKWVDVGATLYSAAKIVDPGVNVGPWNFNERRVLDGPDGRLVVNSPEHPLRLMHFSGFDPERPEEISSRLGFSLAGHVETSALDAVSAQYAETVLKWRRLLMGRDLSYGFERDSSGRRMTRRLRRAYRKDILVGVRPPSPFAGDDAESFSRWRRRSLRSRLNDLATDSAIAAKYVLPDELKWARRKVPAVSGFIRTRLLAHSNVRR